MKNFYRLCRRNGGVYYAKEISTRKQESLKTPDKATAEQLLSARNAAAQQPLLNLAVTRVHLAAHDPQMITRTWQRVKDEFCTHGRDSTQERSLRAFKSQAFDPIRNQPILESTAEDLLNLMKGRGPALVHYLRRLHNLALNVGWLPWPVLPKAAWPKPQHRISRALTEAEFQSIIKAERNDERRKYYEVLWEIGSAQLDAAEVEAENIDWLAMTLICSGGNCAMKANHASCGSDPSSQQFSKHFPHRDRYSLVLPKSAVRNEQQSSGDAAACLKSMGLRCTASAIHGPSEHTVAAIPNDSTLFNGSRQRAPVIGKKIIRSFFRIVRTLVHERPHYGTDQYPRWSSRGPNQE
jgi:hypothetical protein